MINRREFIGITAGAGASLALSTDLLRALEQSGGKLIQRAIPSSGEMLPAISFAPRPGDPGASKEVLKVLLENGGRMVDVLHAGPSVEQAAHTGAIELGAQDKFFWTTPMNIMPAFQPG